jgi:hypothetical protein
VTETFGTLFSSSRGQLEINPVLRYRRADPITSHPYSRRLESPARSWSRGQMTILSCLFRVESSIAKGGQYLIAIYTYVLVKKNRGASERVKYSAYTTHLRNPLFLHSSLSTEQHAGRRGGTRFQPWVNPDQSDLRSIGRPRTTAADGEWIP